MESALIFCSESGIEKVEKGKGGKGQRLSLVWVFMRGFLVSATGVLYIYHSLLTISSTELREYWSHHFHNQTLLLFDIFNSSIKDYIE